MISTVNGDPRKNRFAACAEIALIFALFFVLAGTPPPDVNEAHYVAKAKHYWNPAWCPHDHFLNSADAHLMFYWVFGWLTLFFELPAVTWIGRVLTWLFMAWSWRRFSVLIAPSPLYSLFTAALFATLIRWGHMAGEWVIGGLEAKGFAYIFVWLALEAVIRNRWQRAVILLGGSAAFHVIVGGWALVAVACAWGVSGQQSRPALRSLLPALCLAGIFSLFGLIPGLALSWSSEPEIVQDANRINVFERLSHHLLFHSLPHEYIARHALLLLVWLGFWYHFKNENSEQASRLRILYKVVLGAVAIAVVGIVLDQSLLYFRATAASVLRFYWFRLSDVMLPVGVTFGLVSLLQHQKSRSSTAYSWSLMALLVAVSVNVIHVVYEHFSDPRPGAVIQSLPGDELARDQRLRQFYAWTRVCFWIQNNTPADATFLTPRHQQTFHWYAGRSEIVSAKNFPQDAAGIVQWRQRMDDVFPRSIDQADLSAHGEARLVELAQKYSFQCIILDRAVSSRGLRFQRVYPTTRQEALDYEVYRVP